MLYKCFVFTGKTPWTNTNDPERRSFIFYPHPLPSLRDACRPDHIHMPPDNTCCVLAVICVIINPIFKTLNDNRAARKAIPKRGSEKWLEGESQWSCNDRSTAKPHPDHHLDNRSPAGIVSHHLYNRPPAGIVSRHWDNRSPAGIVSHHLNNRPPAGIVSYVLLIKKKSIFHNMTHKQYRSRPTQLHTTTINSTCSWKLL